ncbi:DUF6503 family protein [Chondrinema litorale]|uniref:DUF6503 family protein n=1 Tax=Chondrinema litorale TaxID=2994555 RepID=UPI002543A39B|nr:DUF6503 family protein [Chondrinema litorale]UZR94349.1 hypothetical protein OQ292_00775 [Chondrinema litorale]
MKNAYLIAISFLLIVFNISCNNQQKNTGSTATSEETISNPPADGFNLSLSDEKAIEIADSVMSAMGGRKSWDDTRFISWNFFGARTLIWDKWTGYVRVENVQNDFKVLVNVNTLEGKVFKNGEEVTQPDSLQKYLNRGKEIWINDSYWLVMPFKLKDSGVTLKYVGEEIVMDKPSDVLELTFQDVGVTPQNKYKVYIDKETNLVNQWAYFKSYEDEEPGFILPWKNYKKHGEILLSGDRGPRQLTDIEVFEELPESIFTSLDAVNLSQFKSL